MARYEGRMADRTLFVCASCGSPAVTREAWAAWDVATQAWVLAELFDYAFCHGCHRRVTVEARPATA
jgi:hypothetical protein